MRPYIVDLCINARQRLIDAKGARSINDKGKFYTEKVSERSG